MALSQKSRGKRAVKTDSLTLHGRRIAFRRAGEGRAILLIHGITNSSLSWAPVIRELAPDFEVIAPDLPGHGRSERQRGDHSLGAQASLLRDLMGALGLERATVVGHSLGGGLAMQFAYQFPEIPERMVLISSGGLGREVSPLLRSAALPGAEQVIGVLASRRLVDAGQAVGRALGRVGLRLGPDLAEISAGLASLNDPERRAAFVRTIRSVVSPAGQRINASDRLYLAAELPTLIVWGERDAIIPERHGREAHELTPGSRLETFEDAGHFPHLDDPQRFAELLSEFIQTTEPAAFDRDRLRERLLAGAPAPKG